MYGSLGLRVLGGRFGWGLQEDHGVSARDSINDFDKLLRANRGCKCKVRSSLKPLLRVKSVRLGEWHCGGVSGFVALRVQVPNNHILTQNLYYHYYYPKPKYLVIGYLDPLGRVLELMDAYGLEGSHKF